MQKKYSIEDIIYKLIIIIMIGIPLGKLISYCAYLAGKVKDTFVINQVYLLWFAIPVLILLYVLQIVIQKRKIDDFDILMYVLIFLGILSTICSVDVHKSIFGERARFEGILSLISYYLIFMNVKNISLEKYKKKIVNVFLTLGVIQVVYALLQVFTQVKFVFHASRPYMGMGLCGNPNFFGSYMVMLSLISVTLYLLKKEKKHFVLAIIYFIGLCLCNSTGPFLSYIISLIFLLIFFNKKIDKMNLVILITCLAVAYFSTDYSIKYIHNRVFHNQIDTSYTISNELGNSLNSYKNGDLGNGRLRIWKNSLDLVDDYFVLGSGPDTFANIYPQETSTIYDKAHNVYLQTLLTSGVFSLIIYCGLCLIIFIKGFKYKDPFKIALYIGFIGYCIQAFANISVIDVAPYFFIILGLLYSYKEDFKEKEQ